MKYRIALALAQLVAIIHGLIAAAEEKLYRAVSNVQAKAWEHGMAAEQAVTNKAVADLERARKALEQANKQAKALLQSQPGRIDAVRAKVFGE
jgi:hypothetical protein